MAEVVIPESMRQAKSAIAAAAAAKAAVRGVGSLPPLPLEQQARSGLFHPSYAAPELLSDHVDARKDHLPLFSVSNAPLREFVQAHSQRGRSVTCIRQESSCTSC